MRIEFLFKEGILLLSIFSIVSFCLIRHLRSSKGLDWPAILLSGVLGTVLFYPTGYLLDYFVITVIGIDSLLVLYVFATMLSALANHVFLLIEKRKSKKEEIA